MWRIGVVGAFAALMLAWPAAAAISPTVEVEEDVYRYEDADNGSGPFWCFGSTCIIRSNQDVWVSGFEKIAGVNPLNNTRWVLYWRGDDGWRRIAADEQGRTREPSPLAVFGDGSVLLSVNPTLAARDAPSGPARPEILRFSARDAQPSFQSILPKWEGSPVFTEHSYRSFAADGRQRSLILLQNIGYAHSEWAYRDAQGNWTAGKLPWPFGAEYAKPQPIRICYPTVQLRGRAVYFCGVSDIVEPNEEWRKYKRQITGREWDYDFRRLFFTWSDDIASGRFKPWVEVASREKTCGWITPCDLYAEADGTVHLLWTERAIDARLRQKFFPEERQSEALNYARVKDGKVTLRKTIAIAREGEASPQTPGRGRFHVTGDGKLLVIYYVRAGRGGENRLIEIRSDGEFTQPVPLPMKRPMGVFFTASVRAGCSPSNQIDLLGDGAGVVRYARIRLDQPAPQSRPAEAAGELLYNGIRLPAAWPPRLSELPRENPVPAYLANPPAVIPIDVGRQLFVDDFLIESTDLKRSHHLATYHPASPVLKPDKPWEMDADGGMAMVFSDGVWYDPKDKLFKMWYFSRGGATCYATSTDGVQWTKPSLDVKPGTNIVQIGQRDSSTVWLDLLEKDPGRRFKMFRSSPGGSTVKGSYGLATFFSPDGIHWTTQPLLTGSCGDRSTVFYNPFRKVWVYSLRHGWGEPRRRRYFERVDLLTGPMWQAITEPSWWIGADALDPMRGDLKIPTQLYNLDAVAYESIILGLFTIWRGQPPARQKPNDIVLGYSRDGWSWHRPDRRAFCPVSDRLGTWNFSNVQSAGGCCLIVGEQLYFYVSGRAGQKGNNKQGVCSTGLATLRRDGFASMDAGSAPASLTTRPLRFSGKHLFVNVDAPGGELRAEILDQGGGPIAPFTRGNCMRLRGEKTLAAVSWTDARDLSAVSGRPVRIRFHLTNGKLYSFWISPDGSGASQGYLAAGGPGYAGPTDAAGAVGR